MKEKEVHKGVHWRKHPILGIEILNSPHRLQRGWSRDKSATKEELPEYLENCQLCPGNKRANGERNPVDPADYPFIFTNDCQAMMPPTDDKEPLSFNDEMYHAGPIYGTCKVVNFHPKHNLTFALMREEDSYKVMKLWQEQYTEIGGLEFISTVNIFENNRFGSSQFHPHNQIWSSSDVAPYLAQLLEASRKYKDENKVCLFCRTAEKEAEVNERMIYQNQDFAAFVPYWAIWPFEIWVVAKSHKRSLAELNERELENLTMAYRAVNIRLDNLFEASGPYSSGFYQSPTDGKDYPEAHLHVVFRPPVVRDVDVWKWMVGYEFMAQPQRDMTPEKAAEILNSKSGIHYTKRK